MDNRVITQEKIMTEEKIRELYEAFWGANREIVRLRNALRDIQDIVDDDSDVYLFADKALYPGEE